MMLKSKIKQSAMAVAFIVGTASAQAGTISLQATSLVTEGDLINLDIYMNFTDEATLGGGFDILFNSTLVSYISGSYVVDAGLNSDPAFTRDDSAGADIYHRIDIESDGLIGLAFGNFNPLTGPALVGSMQFRADNAGLADFGARDTTNPVVGNFYGEALGDIQHPTYLGTTVEIQAVPIPAAVWLFGSGLIGLLGVARRRQA